MANIDSRRTVIAPFILGQYYCEEALDHPGVTHDNEAALFCASIDRNGADRISRFLDSIGPKHSPSGRFSLGYTLNVPLLRYFRQVDGGWKLDVDSLRHNIRTIVDVDRDVVIYLSANHFTDANIGLVRELCADSTNLMWGRDGPMQPDDYFAHLVASWTLSDYNAPITKMREEAFRAVAAIIRELPEDAQQRIVAISVLGEVHDMFPNFIQGPSQTLPLTQVTDYSPIMQDGFRRWLEQRFVSIAALNDALGAHYESFARVAAPSKDFRLDPVDTIFDHVDLFAGGNVSVYGWLGDRRQRPVAIDIYLDGIFQGEAELGLNRTDVTEGNDWISDPNVGWRFDFDYRNVPAGLHNIDVVLRVRGRGPLHMTRRRLAVRANMGGPLTELQPAVDLIHLHPPMSADPDLAGYVDGPSDGQDVIYNPLAPLWLEYRNKVVRTYFEHFVSILTEAGISPHLIHSHQMAPNLYGTWNSDLIASDAMQKNPAAYNHGITLYGGTAFGPAVVNMVRRLGWERYGVNEMHTIVPLEPEEYQEVFDLHHRNGATFIAPYYMSIAPQSVTDDTGLFKYLITSNNELCGSDRYWHAIVQAMSR